MSDLLKHNVDQEVKFKQEVSRESLGFGGKKDQTVTVDTSLRTTNHVVNSLNVLVQMGFGKKMNDVIESLVDYRVKDLTPDEKHKYNEFLELLEKQDWLKNQLKSSSKK